MDPTRVVLDCDTANEVDDQFAIANALGVPEETLNVRGVISLHNTTAHGPRSRDMYQEEAEGSSPCAGAMCLYPARRPHGEHEDPWCRARAFDPRRRSAPGPLTVVATVPATDAASLLLAERSRGRSTQSSGSEGW